MATLSVGHIAPLDKKEFSAFRLLQKSEDTVKIFLGLLGVILLSPILLILALFAYYMLSRTINKIRKLNIEIDKMADEESLREMMLYSAEFDRDSHELMTYIRNKNDDPTLRNSLLGKKINQLYQALKDVQSNLHQKANIKSNSNYTQEELEKMSKANPGFEPWDDPAMDVYDEVY